MPITGYARDEKAIEAEWQRQQNNRGGDEFNLQSPFPLLFLKEGTTLLRILPPYSEESRVWFKEFKEHSATDVLGKFLGTFACPEQFGEACPFCDEGRKLYELGGEANVAASKEFRPRSYFYFNTIVYNSPNADENPQKGVMVLKAGITIKRELLDYDHDAPNGYGDITNPESGFDIRIIRKGKTRFNTEYTVRVNPQRNSVNQKLKEMGVDPDSLNLHNLDEAAIRLDTAKVQQLFDFVKSTPGFEPESVLSSDATPQAPVTNAEVPVTPPPPPGTNQ